MEREDLFEQIIDSISDGVYFVDREQRIGYWNKAAEEITGYLAAEVYGRLCSENILNHIDAEGHPLCVVGCPLYDTMKDGKPRRVEVFLKHKKGYRLPVFLSVFPIFENGEITGAVEIFNSQAPIVTQSNLVEQLSVMAMHDELTELPNRRYLQSFLEYRLSEFKRFNVPFAVLFMDIDDFRVFNNTYGHDAGDTVLKSVSKTVRRATRKADMFGRWGGEEFVGVYTAKCENEVPVIAEKLRVLIANTEIPHGDTPLSVTVSVGITMVRPDDTDESIIERADKLMYQSKQAGKNRITAG